MIKPKAPIRVLHVLEDFSSENTGVTSVVRQMVEWQTKHCEWVGVYSTGSMDMPAPEGVCVRTESLNRWFFSWRYPKSGVELLKSFVLENKINILHLHGLWRAMPILGARVAKIFNIPVVLSVHGQTSPWALEGQGVLKKLKKILYWRFLARRQLINVSVLHAITPLERNHLARFFKREDAVVIPNAIDLNIHTPVEQLGGHGHDFIFLGRLHPVKGVDLLIEAFSKAKFPDESWRLRLAGPAEVPEYLLKLQELVSRSSRSGQIEFLGPVYGKEKRRLLRNSWVMVAPSYSEVIGMVNLEAAEQMLPSVTTHPTGLADWEDGGGVLISPEVNELTEILESVSNWSEEERIRRGNNSYFLVRDRYSLGAVGALWVDLYDKIKKAHF